MANIIKVFKDRNENKSTTLAFLLIVAILGINFLFVRISNQELPPLWGACLRYLIASSLLWIIVFARGMKLPNKKGFAGAIIYGILSFAANSGLLYWALKSASPALASVIYSTIPMTTLVISSLSGLEKISRKNIVAGTFVVFGIYIIFHAEMTGNVSILPLAAIFAGSFFAALSGILIKYIPNNNPVVTNAIGMSAGSQALLFFSLLFHETISLPTHSQTWMSLIWLVISSTFAFILMVWIISKWKISKVSYTSVLSPLVTTVMGILISNQGLSLNFLFGSVLILASVTSVIFLKN